MYLQLGQESITEIALLTPTLAYVYSSMAAALSNPWWPFRPSPGPCIAQIHAHAYWRCLRGARPRRRAGPPAALSDLMAACWPGDVLAQGDEGKVGLLARASRYRRCWRWIRSASRAAWPDRARRPGWIIGRHTRATVAILRCSEHSAATGEISCICTRIISSGGSRRGRVWKKIRSECREPSGAASSRAAAGCSASAPGELRSHRPQRTRSRK